MNNKSNYLKILKRISLFGGNILKELFFLVLLVLIFRLVYEIHWWVHDPIGTVTTFYCVVIGIPLGYLAIGFWQEKARGLFISFIVILVAASLTWIYYPSNPVGTFWCEIPERFIVLFLFIGIFAALGRGVAKTFSKKKQA